METKDQPGCSHSRYQTHNLGSTKRAEEFYQDVKKMTWSPYFSGFQHVPTVQPLLGGLLHVLSSGMMFRDFPAMSDYPAGSFPLYPIRIPLPSGKRVHNYGKIHHFSWENSLFLWQFSIAIFVYQRVNLIC